MPWQTEPPADMLPVEEALARILALVREMPRERKPIGEAVGQVLAEDVVAPFDIPPHDNTAMDGYAVQAADTAGASEESPVRLRVSGELAAGYLYEGALGAGEAVRIMTGAPMPTGADAIVPFEETDEYGLRAPGQEHEALERVGVLKAARAGANIQLSGGGRAGGRDDPAAGAAAAGGGDRGAGVDGDRGGGGDPAAAGGDPEHGRRAAAAGGVAAAGKIYDSNSSGLAALVQEYGGVPAPSGIARDTVEALTAKIREATAQADMVVTSAGVSRGTSTW